MRRAHWVAGVLTLLVFVGTGAYMRLALDGLDGMEAGPRLLYRSRHIYLLGAGLVHLALGTYLVPAGRGWRSGLQLLGSALLLASPLLLVWAFAREPKAMDLNGAAGHFGIFALAGGTLAHALSRVGRGSEAPA